MIAVDIKLGSLNIKIMNIYGPNKDSPSFFNNISNIIASNEEAYVLLCGDLNIALDPLKDTYNYSHINNPNARKAVLNLMSDFSLTDVYRDLHPDTHRYTWRRKNPLKQARLDYYLASNTFLDLIYKCEILPGYRTDHSIIKLEISITKFQHGKGLWKFNTSLLNNQEYLTLINNSTMDEMFQYALPVYNPDYLKRNELESIQLIINENLFLETLLMRLRDETIKFASNLKRAQNDKEEKLIEEINDLERSRHILVVINLLQDKNDELEQLREMKMKGHIVRSQVQWLQHGEKPSKLFCSVENKHFTEKNSKINKKKENGSILTDQSLILDEFKTFYQTLFDSRDCDLQNVNLKEYLADYNINKLTEIQSKLLEGKLTVHELGQALKNMKNGRTSGIDGFPGEFFKVFWSKLKFIIQRAINSSYDNNELPLTLRQCIISCLPKGNKDRTVLKNWRPILLLSVICKMASASIANRLKTILDFLIDKSQTGFITGRYIGHSTRLFYDMYFTEKTQTEGLLMLIDFEKAFDSISWKFLYNVLEFLGFGQNFIKWIKLFNTNILASVIQCGIKILQY